MKAKIGEILLIVAVILFIVGGIGAVAGVLQQDLLLGFGALGLIFVGVGASMKKQVQK